MTAAILSIVSDSEAKQPDLQSVAQCLRNLANNIERGDHGEVIRAAVVIRSEGLPPIVLGQGNIAILAQTYMDLHAGAAELMSMVSPERL